MQSPIRSAAIIGAGISGITCATTLALYVDRVTVFEKDSQAGGRMASKRLQGFEFDLGAQYFTVQDDVFRDHVESWLQDDLIKPWSGWFVDLEHGNMVSQGDDTERFTAVPNMAGLVRHLTRLCDIRYDALVQRLELTSQGWNLIDAHGRSLGQFDLVISSLPAPLNRVLIGKHSRTLQDFFTKVQMSCSWGLALGFDQALSVPFDVGIVNDRTLSLVARISSKPGRATREAWIVQASPEWSERHSQSADEDILANLEKAFVEALGVSPPRAVVKYTCFWPYAAPITPAGELYLYDAQQHLGACGDWCLTPRVEGAFLSGLSLAERVLEDLESL